MSQYYFLEYKDGQALSNWHSWLDDNRGDRARLRRAERPEDILLTEAFAHFLHNLPEIERKHFEWDKDFYTSACVAGAISHVKSDKQNDSKNNKKKGSDKAKRMASFAEQLATPLEGKSKAPMSELRFQQLQKSTNSEDFYRRIIRAIGLLNGQVNIISLANDIIHWHREFKYQSSYAPANRLAVRWATDYFTAYPKN